MYNKNSFGTFLFGCFLTFGYFLIAPCFPFEINTDIYDYVQWKTYLNGSQFWYNAVGSIGSCVRVCIRMANCKSFNFELKSRKCEMNSDVLENHPYQRIRRSGWVYSNKADWPEEIDPDCFSPRSCKADEVSLPTQLAASIGSPTCMKALRRVSPCPKEWLLYGGTCYYVSTAEKTWADASKDCTDKESHLAEIESEKEQRFLSTVLTKRDADNAYPQSYWIFGNDIESAGHWVWGHSDRNVDASYNGWHSIEPNGAWYDEYWP